MIMMSIDPGTIHCGVVVWNINDFNLNIKNIKSFTLHIDDSINVEKRIHLLYDNFKILFLEYQPFQVAHEAAFINRFRPMAYGPIYTSIFSIRKAYIDLFYDPYRLFSYPPKTVKSFVSTGDANKNDMLKAVTSIKELRHFITGLETEHEIDAIAIGYTHLNIIRKINEVML